MFIAVGCLHLFTLLLHTLYLTTGSTLLIHYLLIITDLLDFS